LILFSDRFDTINELNLRKRAENSETFPNAATFFHIGNLEDFSIDHRYYLDLITGEVFFISDESEEEKELHKIVTEWLGKRYRSIPDTHLYEGNDDMEDIIKITIPGLKYNVT
jgi:hypothetical protein